jgi:hypothetical protein
VSPIKIAQCDPSISRVSNSGQWAARYGIDIVPYHTLQRYFKSIDGKSAMRENAAFKLSFGLALVMAGFLRFQ